MKLYKGDRIMQNVDKHQVDDCLAAGWSRTDKLAEENAKLEAELAQLEADEKAEKEADEKAKAEKEAEAAKEAEKAKAEKEADEKAKAEKEAEATKEAEAFPAKTAKIKPLKRK